MDPVELSEAAPLLMTRIIEWARGHVANGKMRSALYCGLIDEFEQLGVFNLEECCKLDTAFEEAWIEMHSWVEDDG